MATKQWESPEQQKIRESLPPDRLMGFCEKEQQWYGFIHDPFDLSSRICPNCGSKPSTKIGFQLTTQRSFSTIAKKLTKAQIKKMGMGA